MVQVISMPMRETMKELAKTAAKLNEASDQLNEVIVDFEQTLEDLGVGVTVWLDDLLECSGVSRQYGPNDLDKEHPIEVQTGWQLGYTKVDNKWRVAARSVREESRDGFTNDSEEFIEREAVALDRAPRLVRVAAAPLLEELATALNKRMRKYLDGIAEAKKQAKNGTPSDEEVIRKLVNIGANPVFDLKQLADFVKVDERTARTILARLVEAQLLVNVQDATHWALSDSAGKLYANK